jgi:hypothetical protein
MLVVCVVFSLFSEKNVETFAVAVRYHVTPLRCRQFCLFTSRPVGSPAALYHNTKTTSPARSFLTDLIAHNQLAMDFNGRMSMARSVQPAVSQTRRQPEEFDAFMIVSL